MFKRVEKRRIRELEKEELGDLKDILGMDTDEDESASDSEDQESSAEEGSDPEEIEDEESEEELPTLTVREALENPIHIVSIDPDIRLCAVCPGKLLKTPDMVTFHKKSEAHQRRWIKFQSGTSTYEPNDKVTDRLLSLNPAPTGVSKRAQKRQARKDSIMAKRKRSKLAKTAKKDPRQRTKKDTTSPDKKKLGLEKTVKGSVDGKIIKDISPGSAPKKRGLSTDEGAAKEKPPKKQRSDHAVKERASVTRKRDKPTKSKGAVGKEI